MSLLTDLMLNLRCLCRSAANLEARIAALELGA
jgi:hypothetical protein